MMLSDMALLIAGALFFLFILVKVSPVLGGRRPPGWQAGRARIQEAKRRARAADADPAERAKAWRQAAVAALEDLERPSLAASYAHRAERADPADVEAVGMLATALRRARRYHALERLLWRRLAAEAVGTPAYDRAFAELVRLYEGPLRRPERATALRRLHAL